ncbi:MAG: response regulator [Paenibacillaceae bacterium]|nr:response regulator [Paenibacillaceae bacterium]
MYRMLIVDDNPNDRRGISGLVDWEEQGIEIAGMAGNGEDGYRKALELRPDFVLTDVSMPLLNGIEMTARIKTELPEARFIFMSCFDDVEYLQSAINLEVEAYVLKPIRIEELIEAVAKARRAKEEQERRRQYEQELQTMVDRSLPLLQEQLLQEIFYARSLNAAEVLAQMNYLHMKLEGSRLGVVFIHIDNFKAHYGDWSLDKKHLLLYSLLQCVKEIMTSDRSGYAFSQNPDAVVVLKKYGVHDDPVALVSEEAGRCIEAVNSALQADITMGISSFSGQPEELNILFSQAEFAAKSKFFSKGNQFIFYSEVCETGSQAPYRQQDISRKLAALLKTRDEEGITDFMDRYYPAEAPYPEKVMKGLSYTIVNMLQALLLEEERTLEDIFGEDWMLWEKIALLETASHLRELMLRVLQAVCRAIPHEPAEGSNRVVEDIKHAIHLKYAGIENVNQILEGLYISASHANLIFKQHTGQTIFDYLTVKRMEAAKELLRDPYVKVYEIPEKIGYKTQAHFRTVFKQYTGLSPKQYQEKVSL